MIVREKEGSPASVQVRSRTADKSNSSILASGGGDMNRRLKGHAPGFTLMELMVTVVIAGFVFAMMVPMFIQAMKVNTKDSFRLIALNVAQDKI